MVHMLGVVPSLAFGGWAAPMAVAIAYLTLLAVVVFLILVRHLICGK